MEKMASSFSSLPPAMLKRRDGRLLHGFNDVLVANNELEQGLAPVDYGQNGIRTCPSILDPDRAQV
jgi:hypothetical protein